ncbi:MAG: SUMF1/EgtB/PvdO family nonheme iron enzyme [Sandaracinaceae bacterium]|nr:SUMF1/EgtB/PvdO family nonheme iron enzyme [Sandaracinaceae bacterium]
MDLLTTRSARGALPSRTHALLAMLTFVIPLATLGCVKPLRFSDLDGSSDDATTHEDAGAHDAPSLDARTDDASVSPDVGGDAREPGDAAVLDAPASDAGVGIVPTSCVGAVARDDCQTALIDPTATFCIGVEATAENAGWSASPPICGLSLSPFYVDRTEVSVGRFRAFHELWRTGRLPATTRVRLPRGLVYDAPLPPRDVLSEWSPLVTGCNWSDTPDVVGEQHPINCVGWSLAMYFCAWEGGHLITSTQYEYLARWHRAGGPAGRAFPWGDTSPTCDVAHYAGCAGDDSRLTRRVGAIALAPQGVFDLAGNVADFVADDFASYATLEASACWTSSRHDPGCLPSITGAHYARGSNYMSPSEALLRSVFRPSTALDAASPVRGFRCAYLAP